MTEVLLRIAVTGHRDVDPAEAEQLRHSVASLLSALRERLPGIQLELVSGMADGADRLAMDAALTVGVRVHALLPMPLDMYLEDFDAGSRADLQARLADPRIRCTELELPPGMNRQAASVAGPVRDELYVALAERLRRGTGVLLALWDGEDTGLPGGTGDTVLRYLGLVIGDGPHAPYRMALDLASGTPADAERPVYRFPTARLGRDRAAVGAAGFLGVTEQGDVVLIGQQLPARLAEELDELSAYANDAQAHVDPAKHRYGLVTDEVLALRPAAADALKSLDVEYRRADLLAIYHQRRSDRLFKAFSGMAALMGLLFLVYAKLHPAALLLILYLVLFVVGIALHWLATRGRWFTRHLMYRAIAESLRTRFFLTVAGVPARGLEQHLMGLLGIGRIAGFSWIGFVVRGATPFTAGVSSEPERGLNWVAKNWLADQHRYFERKSHALHTAHHGLEQLKRFIVGSMMLAIVGLLLFKHELMAIMLWGLPLKTYVVFLLGLVPFWLGVWELYQIKMATKELGWQYRNQLYHLEKAGAALKHAGNTERAAAVLADTAERLLADTYLWTVQRFHRDHEPPAAG